MIGSHAINYVSPHLLPSQADEDALIELLEARGDPHGDVYVNKKMSRSVLTNLFACAARSPESGKTALQLAAWRGSTGNGE